MSIINSFLDTMAALARDSGFAGFMADGVVYEINMYADAYDENGLKADAVPLSDEDFAVFEIIVLAYFALHTNLCAIGSGLC